VLVFDLSNRHRFTVLTTGDLPMRWKIILSMCIAASAMGLALASQSAARAGFDEESIRGAWGLSGTGQLLPPAVPEPIPFASLNRLVFDGAGNCEVVVLVNVGGTLVGPLIAENCEYTVDEDGFGRAVAEFPGGPLSAPLPIAFLIVDKARELRVINTTELLGEGVAKRL
jgi:hypothetical protein